MHYEIIWMVFVFITGLACGSFASVVIYRLPEGKGVIAGRSHCAKCKTKLTWKNMAPLFSWVLQQGRCVYCKKKISPIYPILELICGLLFLDVFLQYGLSFNSLIFIPLSLSLLIISAIDFEHQIIPDEMQVCNFILGIIYLAFSGEAVISLLAGSIFLTAVAYFLRLTFKLLKNRECLGLGDVKFLSISGLFLGFEKIAVFLFLAGLLGTLLGFTWQFFKKSQVFPFGPALAASLYVCLMFPYLNKYLIDIFETFLLKIV